MYSSLAIVTPPAAEPVSVALVKQHCRIDTSIDDTLVGMYAQTARQWVESVVGRCLAVQTLRWTMAQQPPPLGWPLLNPLLLVLPQWVSFQALVQQPLELPRAPLISVQSVSWGEWGAETVMLPSTYSLDLTEPARLRLPIGQIMPGQGNVQVVFTAGYSDPTAIPMPVLHAILLLTAMLYEQRGDAAGEMPESVMRLLWPYRITTFGG